MNFTEILDDIVNFTKKKLVHFVDSEDKDTVLRVTNRFEKTIASYECKNPQEYCFNYLFADFKCLHISVVPSLLRYIFFLWSLLLLVFH